MMKKISSLILAFCLMAVLAACSSTSENTTPETADDAAGNPAGIELTSQIEGVFKGFEGDNFVKIEHDGKVETYEIVDEVTGDLDKVKEGDAIAFSTKEVDGKTVLETLRLN